MPIPSTGTHAGSRLRSTGSRARSCASRQRTESQSRCSSLEPHTSASSTRQASDARVEAYIRHTAQTIYHPTSTCRTGVDDLAVIHPELRVRGVKGLRVVDASIFPSVPRGNTNAPTIAVAKKAADLIRARAPLSVGAAEAAV